MKIVNIGPTELAIATVPGFTLFNASTIKMIGSTVEKSANPTHNQ